jgi:hypothetical protein
MYGRYKKTLATAVLGFICVIKSCKQMIEMTLYFKKLQQRFELSEKKLASSIFLLC